MAIARTGRLTLRPFHSDDQDALEAVFGDPDVMRFGPGIQTRQWIADWIQERAEERSVVSGLGTWAVTETDTAAVIGYCGLFSYPDIGGRSEIELGYRLARRFWGKGYATEAALAVRDHAFDALGLPRLVALIDPANARSLRVAAKLGMRFEREAMLPNYSYPDHLYSIERADVPTTR
ncbi:MAG TPA: GNAT family N-acetyltransferase [Anaerolineales bacterium]|nr:GNAT family N-acetyltransferase [Anaerolineales bacterium]HRF48733.1 GNAT family N-acetyltransferase [Anaerolineales bacterium]